MFMRAIEWDRRGLEDFKQWPKLCRYLECNAPVMATDSVLEGLEEAGLSDRFEIHAHGTPGWAGIFNDPDAVVLFRLE